MKAGVSRRQVASVINPDAASPRALDWKNASERRCLARTLKAARETIDGGYLRWLVP
ncbi:DNA -binding domain-containing protein [Mesorhizobium sp. J428]|uniref:DNA -binding domain-containing protein n=1 Tax=Mesorhizobium sp. J428 TaxID=2898440 RepID=UPI0035AE8EDF